MAALLAVTLLLLGGLGAALWWTRSSKVEIDAASLCPASGPAAIHAMLVDRSEPISPLQQTRIRQQLERVVSEAPVGGRVSLYLAESDGIEALPPLVSLCNPGKDANPIYQNQRRMRERYERDFLARIEGVRERLLLPNPRQTSPIMESLKAVCIDAFGRAAPGTPLRLTIISDMIQHSPFANHYRDRDFEALLRSPRLAPLLADCKQSEVEIIYLLRPTQRGYPAVQTRAHQRFWDLYLQRLNARPRSLEAV
jgi:hypothetical protein